MANPDRVPDPRLNDPLNPIPPGSDPTDPRLHPANTPVDNRVVVQSSRGSGILIAAVVLVLAIIAYFLFVPGGTNTAVPPGEQPAATEPAAPAPDATAPATPAPEATTPAEPAPAPAAPEPESTAPAEPAPANPAPETAPAPAQ